MRQTKQAAVRSFLDNAISKIVSALEPMKFETFVYVYRRLGA